MKKLISKIILTAIIILSYPGKIFSQAPTDVIGHTGGIAPPPQELFIDLVDRVIYWIFLPLGALAITCYSIYFYLKKKKKVKKRYLYIANISLSLMIVIIIARYVLSWLETTGAFGIFY